MSEVVRVKVLEALTPANVGTGEEVLVYNGLVAAIEEYAPSNSQRWDAVFGTEVGSLEEADAAQQLAAEYFLKTAEKASLASAHNHDLWADRFTSASIEMYGQPDKQEAARMARDKYVWIAGLKGNENVSQELVDFLLDVYKPIIEANKEVLSEPEELVDYDKVVNAYNEVMLEKFKPIFDLVDEEGLEDFTPEDIFRVFQRAVNWLESHDSKGWESWEVVMFDSNKLMVRPEKRQIKIGSKRQNAGPKRLKALLAHELLTHARRAENGYRAGDIHLGTGLHGYNDAEEGIAKIAELGFSGESREPSSEAYLEIALALGTLDGKQCSRQDLYKIVYAQKVLKAQAEGSKTETLSRKSWSRVDRIYRGGRGDSTGERQAIYTKDLAYYVGYKKMAKYVQQQLELGVPIKAIFEYLAQGKIDPTNKLHERKLEQVKRQKLAHKN